MNRKVMTIAAFASAAALAIVGVAFVSTNPFAQAQIQQQTPDFNALIKEKLKGSIIEDDLTSEANVIYQSDKRVVLEGEKITLQVTGGPVQDPTQLPDAADPSSASRVENTNIWRAVELIEGYGYHLDQVELTGQGSQGNPHDYLIVMSKQ